MAPAVWIGAGAALATLASAGNVVLLVQEARGRLSRPRLNTRVLRYLAVVCTLIVMGTVIFVRPWYWALGLGVLAIAALVGVLAGLRLLWSNASAPLRRKIAPATAAVLLGGLLITLGGTSGVIDGAALSGSHAAPSWHGGRVLSHPVLYQVFWGASWSRTPTPPVVIEAVAFDSALAGSPWADSIVHSGFGVSSIAAGGCWIDPTPHARSLVASSTASGPFRAEVVAVVDHRHLLKPCPGSATTAFPAALPSDAVLAVWLPPQVTDDLGGISAHGAVTVQPSRPALVVAAFTGSYAFWGGPACFSGSRCPPDTPSYALSHELVESMTNPYGDSWYANTPISWSAQYVLAHGPLSVIHRHPSFQGEVADLCEAGQPDAAGHAPVGLLTPAGLVVAPYYRPGVGCVA
jgi:hypothetical protein